MKSKKTRLNIPGFSYGSKTVETVDVPKIYGGRSQPKKSGNPHSIEEIMRSRGIVTLKWKTKALYAKVGRQEYLRRKRVRIRKYKAPITNNTLPPPCNRRFFELQGLKAAWISLAEYSEPPELIICKAKLAFEITDGLVPILTTTSSREALIMCATLQRAGIGAYFNMVSIQRY